VEQIADENMPKRKKLKTTESEKGNRKLPFFLREVRTFDFLVFEGTQGRVTSRRRHDEGRTLKQE